MDSRYSSDAWVTYESYYMTHFKCPININWFLQSSRETLVDQSKTSFGMKNLEIFEVFNTDSISEINDRIKTIPYASGRLAQTLHLDKIFALLLPVILMWV